MIRGINKTLLFFEDKLFPNLGALFFLNAVTWMMVEAISRQLFKHSFEMATEVITYSMAYAVLLTLAQAGKKDYHISIDVVLTRLPKGLRKFLNLFTITLGFVFSLILLYSSLDTVTHLFETGLKSESTLRLPMWILYLAIPIGSVLLVLYYLRSFYESVKGGEKVDNHLKH
jgi:C4-dicarboxylate transporter DctQ subunit